MKKPRSPRCRHCLRPYQRSGSDACSGCASEMALPVSERGVFVSYESIRRRCLKLRCGLHAQSSSAPTQARRHLDEASRARRRDQAGVVLDVLAQTGRNVVAARRISSSPYRRGCCAFRAFLSRTNWRATASPSASSCQLEHRKSRYLNKAR
jgi:transposase-like protein